MKVTTITIQKSRTINTEGTLGRDAYRKIVIGMDAELDDKDNVQESCEALSREVDMAIAEEVKKLKSTQKKYANF